MSYEIGAAETRSFRPRDFQFAGVFPPILVFGLVGVTLIALLQTKKR